MLNHVPGREQMSVLGAALRYLSLVVSVLLFMSFLMRVLD